MTLLTLNTTLYSILLGVTQNCVILLEMSFCFQCHSSKSSSAKSQFCSLKLCKMPLDYVSVLCLDPLSRFPFCFANWHSDKCHSGQSHGTHIPHVTLSVMHIQQSINESNFSEFLIFFVLTDRFNKTFFLVILCLWGPVVVMHVFLS